MQKIEIINKSKNTAKVFKTIKQLQRKPFQNPSVHDSKGRNIIQPNAMYKAIREHFKNHFNNANEPEVEQFATPPMPLRNPFTTAEVTANVKKLNNNRAAGYDNITAELIKICTNRDTRTDSGSAKSLLHTQRRNPCLKRNTCRPTKAR